MFVESNSTLFALNRVLGYVSNEVPLKIRYIRRRKENLIVTCVDRSFYTWSSSRFSLLSVSPLHEHPITCIAVDTFLIFTAVGSCVKSWRRGVEHKNTYKNSSNQRVHLMLPFGPHLIGIDEANVLTIWYIKTAEVYLELPLPTESFRVTGLCHPPSYINKILLGSEQGEMRLYNINNSTLIYSFAGWKSPITVLSATPALDIIAVGLHNGKIILHNIKFDETIATFMQDWGPVTCLSFRTDGQPIMASASTFGHVVFWNLEERKVVSQLLHAHNAAVTSLEYLPSESLLVTSSPDNSLKLWIFDRPDGSARLLRIREGHSNSPNFIRYHGISGEHILSAGSDGYLRAFNTTTEIANKNLGRAVYRVNGKKISVKKMLNNSDADYSTKMPPIVQFSSQLTRQKEWDNIAAIHLGTAIISTWSFDKCKFGTTLLSETLKKTAKMNNRSLNELRASSIFLTHCGNFLLIGYKSGQVEKFNIQSGIFRGSYGDPKAHDGCVTGVLSNNVNRLVITGSSDQFLRFWSFKQVAKKYLYQMDMKEPITFMRSHSESSLVAVGLQSYSICVLDLDCRMIIRKFFGHNAELTDCTFSPDSRWLVSASMDSTIQTWDIPSGKCLDSYEVERPCIAVSFCPTGMYLATAHVDQVGITLWVNLSIFSFLSVNVADLRSLRISENAENISALNSLVTLATNSRNCPVANRWQTLLQIDIIRERNAAKKVVKEREEAPFILPTIPAVSVKFDLSSAESGKTTVENRITHPNKFESSSIFAKSLLKCEEASDYEAAAVKLKTLSPSLVNFEVASLWPEKGGSIELMIQFLKMLQMLLQSRRHFELSSSYLALFLKNYSSIGTEYTELYRCLKNVSNLHKQCWSNLQNQFVYCISVSKFVRVN